MTQDDDIVLNCPGKLTNQAHNVITSVAVLRLPTNAGNRLDCVVQKTYASQEHGGVREVLVDFIRTEGIPVHSACLGVAGPVRAGQSKISNLPWTIDCREVAAQLKLNSVGLLNDLEAYAYGIDALESKDSEIAGHDIRGNAFLLLGNLPDAEREASAAIARTMP